MDLTYKGKAYHHAMEFESVYNYSKQYKVKGNPTVWRFMDLSKLQLLLNDKALFFAKPSVFVDPLEGSYSNWEVERNNMNDFPYTNTREYMRKVQEFSGISCWHMNDYESAGMWDLYLGSNDGIAIKTDYNALNNSINDLRYRVFTGELQYIDFRNDMTSENIYDTLFYKRKSFAHENELRLMVIASRIDENQLEGLFERKEIPYDEWDSRMGELEEQSYKFFSGHGTLVSCDLNRLIQKLYVSPRSSPEIVQKVKEMVSKGGLDKVEVIQSDLYNDFIY